MKSDLSDVCHTNAFSLFERVNLKFSTIWTLSISVAKDTRRSRFRLSFVGKQLERLSVLSMLQKLVRLQPKSIVGVVVLVSMYLFMLDDLC